MNIFCKAVTLHAQKNQPRDASAPSALILVKSTPLNDLNLIWLVICSLFCFSWFSGKEIKNGGFTDVARTVLEGLHMLENCSRLHGGTH